MNDSTTRGPARLPGARGSAFALSVDGRAVPAHDGESVATALLAAGVDAFRTARDGAPRAPFCHMGTCFECVVRVDGRTVRACLAPATPGAEVRRSDEH
ncbi:(2Fe-2S)-binding protein [Cellulomonas shaoxiangyii]|uniref:(2Fe-2S)-binding protein n=1 Tax=Cellulomonas shaoxiangyii TaxID=2566013 RepID=A0A4P7SGP7_9CELL|nr:(2Fe-2S)-binding protein [Cellulomonas shaoxiangyii]QCB92677.1 (2Fe-2S)-binding protein [Cellulomonas shaoxiangyii]TGY83426.1 (2Fe-2S)-binding protein [Cellulomonas shaoxiangyii]